MLSSIDEVKLNFSPDSLLILNIFLALIMFGVALNLKIADFRRIINYPKSALVGILSQFFVLPLLTLLLVMVIKPHPSIALGMILVSCCPGGNISNFMTHLAGGNAALSVTLTAFSTLLALFFTPLNLQIWGNMYEPTALILQEISLNPFDLFKTIFLILGLPLVIGMWVNHKYPITAAKMEKFFKPFSMLVFIGFVVVAFYNNLDIFKEYFQMVIYLVFLHNAIAILAGFNLARAFKLSPDNQKTLAIETGIQNSGLGLIIIFGFFQGLGGMAIVAAWWGIWHIISGLALAFYWSKSPFGLVKDA